MPLAWRWGADVVAVSVQRTIVDEVKTNRYLLVLEAQRSGEEGDLEKTVDVSSDVVLNAARKWTINIHDLRHVIANFSSEVKSLRFVPFSCIVASIIALHQS